MALTQLASNLGFSYFAYLAEELRRLLGPRSEKDKASHAQGFLQPVLIFTLHAMLHALLHPREGSEYLRKQLEKEASLWKGASGKAFSSTFVKPLEEAVQVLLSLVAEVSSRTRQSVRDDWQASFAAQGLKASFPVALAVRVVVLKELSRVADPNRLTPESPEGDSRARGDFDASSSAVSLPDGKTAKVEEARNAKGASLIGMISEHCSDACIEQRVLPFLYGLLSGSVGERATWSRAASYSSKFLNRVDDLLLHFAKGFSRNARVTLEKKLQTSKRFLLLTVALLQYPLLHPLLIENRSPDEVLLTLVSQQLALFQQSRKRHSSGETSEKKALLSAAPTTTAAAKRFLSADHRTDLEFIRGCLSPADEDKAAQDQEQEQEARGPVEARPKSFASECLLALRESRKDTRLTLQPGAATGRSLAQAQQSEEAKKGVEFSARAATVGRASMRLMVLVLKAQSSRLKELRWQPEEAEAQSENGASRQPTRFSDKALVKIARQLDESAPAVACCFASKNNELVSWGARCLLHLGGLRLAQLERRGAFLAFTTLRIFQNSTSASGGSAGRSGDSAVVSICTKFLALLMLRPKARRWLDGALSPTSLVKGDLLRQLLTEQCSLMPLRERVAEKEKTGLSSRPFCSSRGGREGGSQATLSLHVRLPEEQQQLSQRFFLKEALVAHISDSLEDPQLQLCALFLLKRVLLQHFKEVAARATKRALEEDTQNPALLKAASMGASALQRQRKKRAARDGSAAAAGEAPEGQEASGDAELLPRVYDCVDRVGKVMVQFAASSTAGRKLTAVCAEVYVSFLLNFPMTPRTQQQRVFFLLQQQKYPEAEGRRAALTALQKVLVKFSALAGCGASSEAPSLSAF